MYNSGTGMEILLASSEMGDYSYGMHMPVGYFNDLLEEKRQDENTPNGIVLAARLLLSRSAVVIHFVNTDRPREPFTEGEEPGYEKQIQLAFNDHGGGSESNFKILLNRHHSGREPEQQVLISPPVHDGTPSNMTFHKADFTFVEWESNKVTYAKHLPNVLKTAGVAQGQGHRDHEFYLFGDTATPVRFSDVFEKIGFTFKDSPYNKEEARRLRELEHQAEEHLGYEQFRRWPQDQFAGQLALLETIETAT